MSVEISRRQTLGGFISAGLAIGAATIPFSTIAKAQTRGGTLTIGLTYDVDTLNVYSTGFLGDVQAAVVEGLLAPDSKAKYVPVLALEVPTLANGGI
jgi:peptide/nickel transport system substrate-binding protein